MNMRNNTYKTGIGYIFLVIALLTVTMVGAVEYPPPPPLAEYNLTLNPGWNMASFPVIPLNASVEDIFSGITYRIVGWTGTSYEDATEVEGHKGYWVFVVDAVTINLQGTAVYIEPYELEIGWNLIGTTMSPSQPLPPDAFQVVTWTGWGYTIPTELVPGMGYWALRLP